VSQIRQREKGIFISVFNQLDAQNLFHSNFYFMPLHVSSTCAYHQEVKIALHSRWYHHTYRDKHTEMHGQQNVKEKRMLRGFLPYLVHINESYKY